MSLAFVLLAVNWHVEEWRYVCLSALASLSAFLDTRVLMCLDRHENTIFLTTVNGSFFSALSSRTRQSHFVTSLVSLPITWSKEKYTRLYRTKSTFLAMNFFNQDNITLFRILIDRISQVSYNDAKRGVGVR